jgi:hypothetical protein
MNELDAELATKCRFCPMCRACITALLGGESLGTAEEIVFRERCPACDYVIGFQRPIRRRKHDVVGGSGEVRAGAEGSAS